MWMQELTHSDMHSHTLFWREHSTGSKSQSVLIPSAMKDPNTNHLTAKGVCVMRGSLRPLTNHLSETGITPCSACCEAEAASNGSASQMANAQTQWPSTLHENARPI